MRLLILLSLGLFAGTMAGDIEDMFKVDPEPLLKDQDKWKVLFECLMDRAPCGEYQIVRDTLPKVLASKCEQCTPEQKEKLDNVVKAYLDKYPKDYAEIMNKYFPKPE
uniref:Chemosensory protein CSP2 n=1 Tax=Lobesia botrana TaxID=209534 RepID=A0A345BEM8_9NEOP|nr:chemosensory protein CSP2 [Lobesia botrana]